MLEITKRGLEEGLLGIIISNDLKWNAHIEYVIAKAAKRLYALRLLKRAGVMPEDMLKVYTYNIRSVLDRASDISRSRGAAKFRLLAVNLQIYLRTSSLKRANNIPKLPGVDYVAKNWALVMILKALPLLHFWSVLLLKVQMMTSVRKTLKNAGLISAKPIDF